MAPTQLKLSLANMRHCRFHLILSLLKLRFAAFPFLFLLALPCLIQVSSAQHDHNFREFDSNVVHSPSEMFRDLASLIGKSKENPLAGLDPELIKKFQESGKDFFEKLDDEQKKKAQEFAKKFLRGESIDSPEGRALMDELGVSPDMQRRLAEEYGSGKEGLADKLNQFRNRFNKGNDTDRKGATKSNSGNPGGANRPDTPRNDSSQGKAGGSPNGSARRDSDGTNEGDLDKRNSTNSDSRKKGAGPGDLKKGNSGSNERAAGGKNKQNSRDKQGSDADSKKAEASGQRISKDRSKERGELAEIPKGVSRRNRNGNRRDSSDPRGNSGVGKKDLSQMKKEIEELRKQFENRNTDGGRSAESESGMIGSERGGKAGSNEKVPDLFDQLEANNSEGRNGEERGKEISDSSKRSGGKSVGQSNGVGEEQRDELFKSWLESDAFKEIREFSGAKGPSEFARESRDKALKGFGKRFRRTLDKTIGDNASQELRKSKLDKVFFEAAKKTMDDGDGDGLGDKFGGALNGVLDRVAEAAKKKNEERRLRENQGQFGTGNRSGGNRSGNSQMGSGGSNSIISRETVGGSQNSGPSLLDSVPKIPEIPSFDFKKVLMALALILFAGLLIYLLFRGFVSDDATNPRKKFGRSFKKAKISSPKDLVEAVDYFIVNKFGTQSRWWNARHAQKILCAGAPGSSAKITGLIKDYVRARYTRADVELSTELQQKYKSTLQELSEEVMPSSWDDSNKQSVVDSAGFSSNAPAKG